MAGGCPLSCGYCGGGSIPQASGDLSAAPERSAVCGAVVKLAMGTPLRTLLSLATLCVSRTYDSLQALPVAPGCVLRVSPAADPDAAQAQKPLRTEGLNMLGHGYGAAEHVEKLTELIT
jgi:hypothetical protein